jgi:hypothetical protein
MGNRFETIKTRGRPPAIPAFSASGVPPAAGRFVAPAGAAA